MLTELRVADYKSFAGATTLPLRKITALLGKNNSGKTAVARLPLLLLSAISQDGTARTPLPLRVRGVHYGSSLLELTHSLLPHGSLALGLSLSPATQGVSESHIDFRIQHRQSLLGGLSAFVSEFDARPLLGRIAWDGDLQPPGAIVYDDLDVTGFSGVLPQFLSQDQRGVVQQIRQLASEYLAHTIHLTSIRQPLEPVFENRPPQPVMDPSGEEVPYLLNAEPELLDVVSTWYARELEIPGVRIGPTGPAFRLLLRNRLEEGTNLARAGQGIQQVLPVATYLLGMSRRLTPTQTLVVEEPELHLHPAIHGALADLAVRAVTDNPVTQVIFETHSENLLLRLRRRVADGTISPGDIQLLWFEQTDDLSTAVAEIEIHDDGSVTNWPRGVFSEDLDEVREIVRATQR